MFFSERVNASGTLDAVFYSAKWVNLLIIKILMFVYPRFYTTLSMDEKQGNTIKVCYGVSP
mgnify:CR=1 FL=1